MKSQKWREAAWTAAALIAGAVVIGLLPCLVLMKLAPGPVTKALELPQQNLLREGRLCVEQAGCEPAVLVVGLLHSDAREKIDARIAQAKGAPLKVCFASPGGDSGLLLGPSFPANVTTCVPRVLYANGAIEEGKCESACVWLWMAGQHRELFRFAHLGLHDPYLLDSCACKAANWLHARYITASMDELDRVRLADQPQELARRRMLIDLSHDYGPHDEYEIFPKEAVTMGLQSGPVRKAVFIVDGAPENLL